VSVAHNVEHYGEQIAALAARLGLEPEALHGVAAAEVGAIPTAVGLPVIRFEVHVCLKRAARDLSAVLQQREAPSAWHVDAHWYRAGSTWERVHSGRQGTEWGALAGAAEVDPAAAMESASYGVGQLMGYHWQMLGYPSVHAMVARAMRGVPVQLQQWGRYLERDGEGALLDALRLHDWEAFARRYNGTGKVAYYASAIATHYEAAARLLAPTR